MKALLYIWKKKWILLITGAACALLFLLYACTNTYFSESMIVSLIYPNSEKGLYPDGTRYNIYEIVSDTVLQKAVDQYNADSEKKPITLTDVEKAIGITEYISSGIQEKVQNARDTGQDYSYFANEYIISCKPRRSPNLLSPGTLFGFFPKVDSKLFLEELYSSYTLYFMDEHTEMNIIPRLTENLGYDGYDYVEVADVFDKRVSMYINYLETKVSENGSYRSTETDMTFNDLIAEFKNLRDVHIQKLKSFVSSSKLAKDPVMIVNKLKAQNEKNLLQYNKLMGESEISKKAMQQYDHTYEENIVITGVNEEIGLYQARAKTAYDTVTTRALNTGVSAQNLLKDIQENERLIAEYGVTDIQAEEYARLTNIADQMVSELEKENSRLIQLANDTVENYLNYKSSNYVRKTPIAKSYLNVGIYIKLGAVFVFGAAASLFVLVMFDKGMLENLSRFKPRRKNKSGKTPKKRGSEDDKLKKIRDMLSS